MPRRDWPDYSVTEYLLCALCMAGAVVCLIAAGRDWAYGEAFDALEDAGAGLLLLGGSVDPVRDIETITTELVLSHKHPDDYQAVANTLDEVRRHHQAFSTRHRIIDTTGRIHHVIGTQYQYYIS